MLASLQKALMGNGPGLQKAIMMCLLMTVLAVVDWPLAEIWGVPEEDWHGRWWRQHLPTGAWLQTGPHGWLPEPVFSNGWDQAMWQHGQYVGPWPSPADGSGTSPWPAQGPSGSCPLPAQGTSCSSGSGSSGSRGPDGQADLKQAKTEPDDGDAHEEDSGLQKALEILGQLLPRCSRFDARGFRSQVRRNLRRFLEREGIPLPPWLFSGEPGRVAQFARWAKQVRHEVEFRRRQGFTLDEGPGISNSSSSSSSSSSSESSRPDDGPRPSGSSAGPRPAARPAEGQTAEESNSSSLMDTVDPRETQSDPGPRLASPEEGDTKAESSDEEKKPDVVDDGAAPVSVSLPAEGTGAASSLPAEGTGAASSLPAGDISGHDTLSIAYVAICDVCEHLGTMAGGSKMKKPAAQEKALPEQGNGKKPEQGNAGNGGSLAEGALVKAEPKSPAKAPPVKMELVSPKKGASPKRAATAAAKAHPKIGQSEAKKMNQQLKALAKAGKTALPDTFAKCKSQAEKRQFFYEVYLLDPEISERRVAKTDVQAEEDRDDTQKGWFTDDEIAGFKGIFPHSSDYSSLKKACVQDLLEREHEDENLAKLGIKQYYFEHCKTFSSSSKKRELQLEENVGDVGQEDFEEIRKKLKGAATQKMISKGQSGRLPGEGKDKEAEVRIDHEQNYKDQRKKLTGQLTQVSTELATVELLKVSLDHKKHKMATVVLAQVAELESKLYSCKKEVMDSQHMFPKQPEKDHEELASKLAAVVASISEKLKPLKRELSSHKKWDEENA
ncbi:unnamed protein product [Symbiodinium sp. CCMP2592]|nr:unnamed protein product [Symbiodinium sp. CCMP2592]